MATPTDYDHDTNAFNTNTVEEVVADVVMLIRMRQSLLNQPFPSGLPKRWSVKITTKMCCFSPEFLREGKALIDNLYPSGFDLLVQGAEKDEIDVLLTDPTEAEAIKLFANTYLAMRVAYFNELDTYAQTRGLNSQQIIEGVGLDPELAPTTTILVLVMEAYCLPKDTKQLRANYSEVPQNLIQAIVDAKVYTRDLFGGDA